MFEVVYKDLVWGEEQRQKSFNVQKQYVLSTSVEGCFNNLEHNNSLKLLENNIKKKRNDVFCL